MNRPRLEAADVRRQVSILTLLPSGPEPRKTGPNAWIARCPFHEDGRPSMSVRFVQDGWRFNCFACGAKGSVIDFVMLRDRCTFKEAMLRVGDGVQAMAPPPDANWMLCCDGAGCKATRKVWTVTYAEAYADALSHGWVAGRADDGRMYCPPCQAAALVRHATPAPERRAA